MVILTSGPLSIEGDTDGLFEAKCREHNVFFRTNDPGIAIVVAEKHHDEKHPRESMYSWSVPEERTSYVHPLP